jgi:hypothetical protein
VQPVLLDLHQAEIFSYVLIAALIAGLLFAVAAVLLGYIGRRRGR